MAGGLLADLAHHFAFGDFPLGRHRDLLGARHARRAAPGQLTGPQARQHREFERTELRRPLYHMAPKQEALVRAGPESAEGSEKQEPQVYVRPAGRLRLRTATGRKCRVDYTRASASVLRVGFVPGRSGSDDRDPVFQPRTSRALVPTRCARRRGRKPARPDVVLAMTREAALRKRDPMGAV